MLTLILVFSIGLKVAAVLSGNVAKDPVRDRGLAVQYIARLDSFLNANGFTTDAQMFDGDRLSLRVNNSDCDFMMLPVDPNGWDSEEFVRRQANDGNLTYVTRFGLFSYLPTFYTVPDVYFSYVARLFDVQRADPMIFVIAMRKQCELTGVNWADLYH